MKKKLETEMTIYHYVDGVHIVTPKANPNMIGARGSLSPFHQYVLGKFIDSDKPVEVEPSLYGSYSLNPSGLNYVTVAGISVGASGGNFAYHYFEDKHIDSMRELWQNPYKKDNNDET